MLTSTFLTYGNWESASHPLQLAESFANVQVQEGFHSLAHTSAFWPLKTKIHRNKPNLTNPHHCHSKLDPSTSTVETFQKQYQPQSKQKRNPPLQKRYHPEWPLVVAVHEKRWWALEVRPPWNLPNAWVRCWWLVLLSSLTSFSNLRTKSNKMRVKTSRLYIWLKLMVIKEKTWETDYDQIHEVGGFKRF